MIRKMIPVLTAAAISMSITFVVPVAITAVSSFTFVTEAQAFGLGSITKSVKKAAKKTKRVAKRKYKQTKKFICPSGKFFDNGVCGRAVDPNTLRRVRDRLTPRIGDPVRGTKDSRDHRTRTSGVAISYNPLRWR